MSPGSHLQAPRMLKAIRDGKIDQIQSLIDDGFPLESILTGEITALGEAVNVGDPSIISLLLSHGAKALGTGPILSGHQ